MEAQTTPAELSSHSLAAGPKLNLGCGPVQPEGWLNIDGSNRAWLASKLWAFDKLLVKLGVIPPTEFGPHVRWHNLKNPLPFENSQVSAIYAGELWEHFELPDSTKLTEECYRVLAPGGVLRVCVPDGPEYFEKYLSLYREQMALPKDQRSSARIRPFVQLFFDDIYTRPRLLTSMGHYHKWVFDEVQLIELFERAGFKQVERAKFHVSRIPDISKLERSDFLIVEGVKR